MLSDFAPSPSLPTSDLDAAKAYYEGLGFTAVAQPYPDGVAFAAGAGGFFVYKSAFAGTNRATAMMFEVPADQFDGVIAALRDKGVTFDTFEMEGPTWEGDVLVYESMRTVWFHDPDGNIISIGTPG